jgi:hypothetical protein
MIPEETLEEELKWHDLEIVEIDGKLYIQWVEGVRLGFPTEIISPPFENRRKLENWWAFIKDLFYIEPESRW